MKRVLFICVHNSARSQMAEAYLKMLAGDAFHCESAGFEPTQINPLVVEVMREEGVDLSGNTTQKVFDVFKAGKIFDYVVTVCGESADAMCPVFPGMTHRLHLPFDDPSTLTGSKEEQLASLRSIRNKIKAVIEEFIDWERSSGTKHLGVQEEFKPIV